MALTETVPVELLTPRRVGYQEAVYYLRSWADFLLRYHPQVDALIYTDKALIADSRKPVQEAPWIAHFWVGVWHGISLGQAISNGEIDDLLMKG